VLGCGPKGYTFRSTLFDSRCLLKHAWVAGEFPLWHPLPGITPGIRVSDERAGRSYPFRPGLFKVVVGGEYDRDTLSSDLVNDGFDPLNTSKTFHRTAYAFFVEARAPIVANRVNAEAYTAFDVKPGDKLYLAPDQRVHIW
jgi:hypothetical protein